MGWAAVTMGVLTAALCAMWVALLGEQTRPAACRARVLTRRH
jgi:hypothetical protein